MPITERGVVAAVVGIDVGRVSAWAAVDLDSLEFLASEEFRIPGPDAQAWAAYDTATSTLRDARTSLERGGHEVAAVMIERGFLGRNSRSSLSIARLEGFLTFAALRAFGAVALDSRTALELRSELALPKRKAEAHLELLRRRPEAVALGEHERDALVCALVCAELALVAEAL